MSAVLFDTNALVDICRENDVAKLEVLSRMVRTFDALVRSNTATWVTEEVIVNESY